MITVVLEWAPFIGKIIAIILVALLVVNIIFKITSILIGLTLRIIHGLKDATFQPFINKDTGYHGNETNPTNDFRGNIQYIKNTGKWLGIIGRGKRFYQFIKNPIYCEKGDDNTNCKNNAAYFTYYVPHSISTPLRFSRHHYKEADNQMQIKPPILTKLKAVDMIIRLKTARSK